MLGRPPGNARARDTHLHRSATPTGLRRADLLAMAALLALAWPVWSIMLRPDLDLWRMDDGEPHLLRIYAMRLALEETLAYPRWVTDLYRGYGYPVFNFYAPLTYYAAALLDALGLSIWNAFRALGLSAIAAGATGAYALVRVTSSRVTGNRHRSPAIAAGLLYVVAPYPFVTNLYLRGDLPEAVGLGVLPWFLLAVDRCLVTDGRGATLRTALVAATLGAALLLVHQLSAAMGLVAAALWAAARLAAMPLTASGRGMARLAAGGIVASGLVAFSAVPTLAEGSSVHLELIRMPVLDMTEKLAVPFGGEARPILSHPGADPGLPGAIDWEWGYRHPWGQPPTFGPVKPAAAHAVVAMVASAGIVAILALRALGSITGRDRGAARPAGAAGGAAIATGVVPLAGPVLVLGAAWLLNTTWTEVVWANFGPMEYIQFPSRLWGPFSLGVALAAGMLLDRLAVRSASWRRAGWVAAVAAVAAVAVASLAAPPIPFRDGVSHAVDADALLRTEFNRDLKSGGAATANAEFTPVAVDIAVSDPGRPRGNQVLDREHPPGAWVGSTAMVYGGTARITGLRNAALRYDIDVHVESDGATVALRQSWFPGWRAFVDGAAAPVRVPAYDPSEDSRLGFQLVDVPAGHHVVTFRFGSTRPRLLGDAVTAVTAVAIAIVLASHLGRAWRTLMLASRAGWVAATVAATGFAGAAVAQLAFEASMSLPPRPVATAPNLVVADLADLVEAGQARLASPTGSEVGADKFIDVRWLLVGPLEAARPDVVEFPHGGRQRRWLYMHPASRATFDVTVSDADTYLVAGIGLATESWYADYGDGVRFAVDVAAGGAPPVEMYAQRLNPRAHEEERRWVEVRVPLAAYAGQPIELTLRTDPVDDPRNDWAGWGNPMVVIDRTVLRPANGPDVPPNVGPSPRFAE